jgi:purine nucleoside phosphorylase
MKEISHEEVLEMAAKAEPKVTEIVKFIILLD